MTNLTTNEAEVLSAIIESEYQVSDEKDEVIGHAVWMWNVSEAVTTQGKAFSGVISSLIKKGFAGSQDEGDDAIIWVTYEGWNILAQN